jgi:hypothetical protein
MPSTDSLLMHFFRAITRSPNLDVIRDSASALSVARKNITDESPASSRWSWHILPVKVKERV